MKATIKADGDTWRARLGGARDERVVVFFCVTTDQRPYRVVPVGERFSSDEELMALTGEELAGLFDRSTSMGAPTAYPSYGS